MFSKTTLRKSAKVLAILSVLLAALVFMGCPMEEEDDAGNLNGTWLFSNTPSYIIDTTAKTIKYFGYDGDDYKADIVNTPNFSAKSGVLIIQFTSYIRVLYDASWTVIGLDVDPVDAINHYGALYWTQLRSKSVKMADYWDYSSGATHVMYSTLQDAEDYFTMAAGATIDWGFVAPLNK